jgi:RNA polymerase sigma factor (sigma-70 family)
MSTCERSNWEHLLAAYLSGQPGADRDLIIAASPVVNRAVRALLCGPDAEDAAQEALLHVVRKAHTVREPSAFLGWINIVARNAARRVRRRQARAMLPVESAVFERHACADAIDTNAIEDRIDASGALDLLDRLSERERCLMLLLTSDGALSYDDVASRLGWPVGSIGPTRQRALSKLRGCDRALAAAC